MELDRQQIERRDFPIVRRGYDPATVDAHLRALSEEVEELRREAEHSGRESLATVAGTQVQGILEAAQSTADTIEREAAQDAQRVREAATADAKRTRDEAIARAREHVAAVSQATEILLARVGSLDGETRTLVESLRAGAGRLAGDLTTVEGEMEALYDAAAGRVPGGGGGSVGEGGGGEFADRGRVESVLDESPVFAAPMPETHSEPYVEGLSESHAGMQGDPYAETVIQASIAEAVREPAILHEDAGEQPFIQQAGGEPPAGDLDGARLVALNMALNGDSRQDTGRYLAENFDIAEPERLLDEVYAVIEG